MTTCMKKKDKMYYIHRLADFVYEQRKDYCDEHQSFSDYDTIRMFGDWWVEDAEALEKIKTMVFLFEHEETFKALDLLDSFIGNKTRKSILEYYKRFI